MGQSERLLLGRPVAVGTLRHEAPARALGHADDRVGQQPPVVVFEAGIDEGVDRFGDGVFDRAQSAA